MTAVSRLLLAAAVLMLAGCAEQNDPADPSGPAGKFRTTTVTVDGREVPCITWKHYNAGGLSCDWSAQR